MTESLRQKQFLTVLDRDEAERRFRQELDLTPLEPETVPLTAALGRVLAGDVQSPIDVPGFDRSNVDGFAVRATDTFGASEDRPAILRVNAETLTPGAVPHEIVAAGSATPIATGGMIPRGADAVVMIEDTELRGDVLQLRRPAAPGANITFAGTDVGRGEAVFRPGTLLTSRDTGVLAALGIPEVSVVRRPRVAVISTGDELVPPGIPLRPGQVYDSNGTVLADAVRELGGEPVSLGIIPDDPVRLETAVRGALAECDMLLLSGGTSKGEGDVSYRVVGGLGPPGVLAHGVALKPGKPLCLAAVDRPGRRTVPVAVVPGFPTSALFTFHEFLAPVIRMLAGRSEQPAETVTARLPMRINSERGRTEYVLAGLTADAAGGWTAYPMGKGSGSVTAFSTADGFFIIPRHREYQEQGEAVKLTLLGAGLRPADLVVIGSHCLGLDRLLGWLHAHGVRSKLLVVGSTGGLEAAKRGECDLAGVHLLDPATQTYNRRFVTPDLELIAGYGRSQGIVYRRGDERFERRSAAEAVAAALADPNCVLVNRNRGSGTRLLIEQLLGSARPPGYLAEARSHSAVAAAVAQERADWGVAIEPAARLAGLGFLPVQDEQFDFVVPKARRERAAVKAFVALLRSSEGRHRLTALGFTPSPA